MIKYDSNGNELKVGDYARGIDSGYIYQIIADSESLYRNGNHSIPAIHVGIGRQSYPALCNLVKMDPKEVMHEVLIGEICYVA